MSIYRKQSDDLKTFDSAEEFLKYYENNRKDIDSTHTRSLNLKFKIDGHHLGRKQGKLILYPINKVEENVSNDDTKRDITDSNSDLKEMYEQLKQAVLDLNERLKKLEEYFKPQTNSHLYYHK